MTPAVSSVNSVLKKEACLLVKSTFGIVAFNMEVSEVVCRIIEWRLHSIILWCDILPFMFCWVLELAIVLLQVFDCKLVNVHRRTFREKADAVLGSYLNLNFENIFDKFDLWVNSCVCFSLWRSVCSLPVHYLRLGLGFNFSESINGCYRNLA